MARREDRPMADKDPWREEPGLAERKEPEEDDAPERKKERLKDLDVTDAEAGALKGGVPIQPDTSGD
jgi:hypothetical protein